MKKLLVLFISLFFCNLLLSEGDMHKRDSIEFTVVILTYNNASICKTNLDSVLCQRYPCDIIIVNDASTDGTGELLDSYIKRYHLQHRVKLIQNKERKGALRNWDETIRTVAPHKVIVQYDGDDWFASPHVLDRIAAEFLKHLDKKQINSDSNKQVWMTWGSYKTYPYNMLGICEAIPESIRKANAFRYYKFVTSHPRAFYAGLYHCIDPNDLKDENGEYFPVMCDVAIMLRLLELSANGHYSFIPDILYIYNQVNPISDSRIYLPLFTKYDPIIRSKGPYQPLDELPFLKNRGNT